jgi:hypothetical protein
MAARVCVKHIMPDGTIMDGPVHDKNQQCIEYVSGVSSEGRKYKKGGKVKNPRFNGKNKPTAKDFSAGGKYSVGGKLVGPSHEEGGIQVIVDGTEPIEVEGGEFVINKKTVDSVGEDFLHKLNHTDTPYHDSSTGYQEGQLPSPSQYADGGKINNRRNEMRRGRRTPARKMARGGRTRPVARGGGRSGSRKMARGGTSSNCGHSGQLPCTSGMGGYRRGGRFKSKRTMAVGGNTLGMHSAPRKQCRTIGSDRFSCNQIRGCNWSASQNVCF